MIRTLPSESYPGISMDDHNTGVSPPPYSPEPTNSESRLVPLSLPDSAPSSSNDDALWSSTTSFLYESPLVNVSLGSRVWDLRLPVYGFNGLVQGAVKLSRKCSHVVRVEVSVERAFLFYQCRAQLIDVFSFAASGKSQNDRLREGTGF